MNLFFIISEIQWFISRKFRRFTHPSLVWSSRKECSLGPPRVWKLVWKN